MKTGKLILTQLAIVMLFASTAIAQMETPEAPTAEQITSSMQLDLGLTNEQVQQITPVIEKALEMQNDFIKNASEQSMPTFEDIKAQGDKIVKMMEEEFTKYFTPEQLAKWKEQVEMGRKMAEESMKAAEEESAPQQ